VRIEEDEPEEPTRRKRIISREEVFNKKYGWYNYVMLASDQKFINVPAILNRNFHEFLTYIEYMKEFKDVEDERIEKARRK